MKDLRAALTACGPDRLAREAVGLAALCTGILVWMFLPGAG